LLCYSQSFPASLIDKLPVVPAARLYFIDCGGWSLLEGGADASRMTITQFGPIQGKAIAFSICQQRGDRVEEKNAWCAATLDLNQDKQRRDARSGSGSGSFRVAVSAADSRASLLEISILRVIFSK